MTILKPLYIIISISVLLLFCGVANSKEVCPLPKTPVKSENEAIILATKAVRAYKLTSLDNACLRFQTLSASSKAGYVINVREKHSPECGGDPMVEPRLFAIKVRPNGRMSTDAYNPALEFESLSCKKKPFGSN